MFKRIYYANVAKQLVREPMMLMLFLVPIIIPIIFRLLLTLFVPWLASVISINITVYHPYILAFALMLPSCMLGVVMGFMLLEDKDAHITELMCITPAGRSGYLVLRLTFVFLGTLLYTLYSYLILGLYIVSIPILLYLALLFSFYSCFLGMLLFTIADDKVKGLSYSKALNLLCLFAFADLAGIRWVSLISAVFPTYWIPRIIIQPSGLTTLAMGLIVHIVWFLLVYLRYRRKET